MSDLYEEDILTWSERQADLLRRLAAGERVNDQVDWENVVEANAARAFQESMRQRLDMAMIYRRARHRFPKLIDGQPALPDACPVTLDELLTQP